jgi:hypothetical protein
LTADVNLGFQFQLVNTVHYQFGNGDAHPIDMMAIEKRMQGHVWLRIHALCDPAVGVYLVITTKGNQLRDYQNA